MSRAGGPPRRASYEPGRVPEQRPGATGGARERNRQQRTQELCAAALTLFLERGVETTTVDEITREAKVAKGSFYRYFEDKTQLVETLLAPLQREIEAAMTRCSQALETAPGSEAMVAAYTALAANLTQLLPSSSGVVRLYLQESRAPAVGARTPIASMSEALRMQAVELTRVAQERGLLKKTPLEPTAVAVVSAIEGVLSQHFSSGSRLSLDEAATTLITMVVEGLRA